MNITTEYSQSDLHKGICKSCGDKTLVLDEGILESRFDEMCPDCIESIKFEEMTGG